MNEHNKKLSMVAKERRNLFRQLRADKLSFNEIGRMQTPPITGERVRQIVYRVKK